MLTLTRKVGQKIRIGDDIEIVVREIRGRQVRLGISAPQGLAVYREELYQQIKKEGLRAGSSVGGRAAKGSPPDAGGDDPDSAGEPAPPEERQAERSAGQQGKRGPQDARGDARQDARGDARGDGRRRSRDRGRRRSDNDS